MPSFTKYLSSMFLAGTIGFGPLRAQTNGALTFGFVGQSTSHPDYQVALAGARQAATDLAATYETKIKIEDLTPSRPDPALQVAAIEKLIGEKADGITLACADNKLLPAEIDKAVSAGLQVATFDSDAPTSKRFFGYMSDNEQCGQTLVVALAKAMGGKGTIAILSGAPESVIQSERVAGVKAGSKIFPGLTIRGVYPCDETTADAVARIAEVMKKNPDITGWVLTGGWPLSAPKAFPWSAGTVKCVAVGLLPSQLDYLHTGYVQMVVAQPFYEWGYRTVERLVYRLSLNRKPADPIEYAAINAVTPANAADFAKTTAGWNVK